jgi:anti-anti-sigma factor
VDGFRYDAAKYVYYGDHKKSVAYWQEYLTALREQYPGLYTVAEVWDGDGVVNLYYPATNCFNFTVSQVEGLIAETAKQGNAGEYTKYVEKYLSAIQNTNPDAMYLPFLTNHDMDRIAGALTVASGNMQMAANLYILGPGSPFLYYGEELGMRGSRGSAQTDANRRLAMVWGDGDTTKDPEGATYGRDKQIQKGVKDQKGDEKSLYSYYKKLIMIRKANPAIARGDYRSVFIEGSKVGGFTSTWNGKTVCVLHNTTGKQVTLDLAELVYISSAGLRVLLTAHKAMMGKEGMKITHVNDVVQEVFEVTGFSDILTIE